MIIATNETYKHECCKECPFTYRAYNETYCGGLYDYCPTRKESTP